MVILDERADLWADRGPIKAHHKELAHLPVEAWKKSQAVSDNSSYNIVAVLVVLVCRWIMISPPDVR